MLTHVRIRLPAGTRASPALAALGELRRHGRDWRLTLATDLRAGGLRAVDRQLDALNAVGCERIFEDRASGAKTERPGLSACLDFLRKGVTTRKCWICPTFENVW